MGTTAALPGFEGRDPARGHNAAVDYFHQAFLKAYSQAPTWGGKQVKNVNRLVRLHGLEVWRKRVDVAFSGRIDWPPPPITPDVFCAHFDRFVIAPAPELRKLSFDLAHLEVVNAIRKGGVPKDGWSHPAIKAAVERCGGLRALGEKRSEDGKRVFFAALKEALGR